MKRLKGWPIYLSLTLILLLVFIAGTVALADTTVDPKDVFLKMPTSADLNKEYDGKQPAWVDFDYNINPVPTLWVNDKSKGEDGLGLVYLDIYRQNEASGQYEEYDMGRYPGNMEGPGFNMDAAGFFNYGPRYGERYFSLKTVFVGKYKAVWLIPIYGTNTENFNEYEYVSYEVEFEITPPGVFTQVPELTRPADGKPVQAPEPAYDLSKAKAAPEAAQVQTHEYWYAYDAEAEHYAGAAINIAPSAIGKYVYRLQVTDGGDFDENVYAAFELTDPDYVEPFYRLLGDNIFDVPPTDPSKVYDGKPVTFEDMNIKYDVSRVGKTGANEWYEYIWYEPNRYGSFTNAIGELQGGGIGPSEPGTYNFQFGVHGDEELEGFIYVKFTISPAENTPAEAALTVQPTASTVYINDQAQAFEAYNIAGSNFFKLRDLAAALNGTDKQFAVGYDDQSKAITLTGGQAYTPVGGELAEGDGTAKNAAITASSISLGGQELELTVYNIGGNNFFKLRDLMQALDVYVGYDEETKNISVDTSREYVEP